MTLISGSTPVLFATINSGSTTSFDLTRRTGQPDRQPLKGVVVRPVSVNRTCPNVSGTSVRLIYRYVNQQLKCRCSEMSGFVSARAKRFPLEEVPVIDRRGGSIDGIGAAEGQ
jgi:hypothetical protein